jgi:hypothetical protein
MSLKEPFIDRYGFNRADALIRDKLFNAVNQQHRVAVREHRHNPADVIVAKISPAHSA